jgi:hypothetical protein
MDILLRKNFYDKSLWHWCPTPGQWLALMYNPRIVTEKDKAPLVIYGNLVAFPKLTRGTMQPAYIADNIASLYFLQLDYDSSISIDEWMADHKALSYALYTSHSHGYKGNHDRFRVIIPLAEALDVQMQDYYFKQTMADEWGCDPSCFDRAHCQVLPIIREKGAPYRCEYHKGCKYSIDWKKVEDAREKAHNEVDFHQACVEFNCRFMEAPNKREEDRRRVEWAKARLSEMREGNRNQTSFSVLSYLKRNDVDYMCIDELAQEVPADFIDEFRKMAARIL